MKKYSGIRAIDADNYEINFRPFKKAPRVFRRIKASSRQEAFLKRSKFITEHLKVKDPAEENRGNSTWGEVWASLERNIISDNLPIKTRQRYKLVFDRMFTDFRLKRFPHITAPSQLSLPFFEEYKGYYGNDLKHAKGVRAEMIVVKSMIRRLRKLRFCSEEVLKDLREVRTPRATKKAYPDISNAKLKELFSCIKSQRPDLYGIVYFMFRTGRRVEETTLIERKDLSWAGFKINKLNIRAETTKTDTAAPLNYLDADLQDHVRAAYIDSKPHKSPYLFLNRQGKKVNQRRVTECLGTLSEDLLKVRITSHYFRHRFCTECGKANMPIADVMAVSGIRDAKILTEYYSHSTTAGQAKVLDTMRLA